MVRSSGCPTATPLDFPVRARQLSSMFLHRYGDRDADTLVLLHGIPGSAGSWKRVRESLGPACHVVVPDLLGFDGGTPPSDLRAEAQAASLAAALDEAGIDRATIVGHDFGGPISLSLYRQRPDLFGAIALMATNASPRHSDPLPTQHREPSPGGRCDRARAVFGAVAQGDAADVRWRPAWPRDVGPKDLHDDVAEPRRAVPGLPGHPRDRSCPSRRCLGRQRSFLRRRAGREDRLAAPTCGVPSTGWSRSLPSGTATRRSGRCPGGLDRQDECGPG